MVERLRIYLKMIKLVENNTKALILLCKKYKVARLDLFGSAATGEFDPARSDIDFLVEFDNTANPNRFDNFFELLEELKELFDRHVDLVEPEGLRNPYFIETINKTRAKIYAAS